jgi:hypothetical protein
LTPPESFGQKFPNSQHLDSPPLWLIVTNCGEKTVALYLGLCFEILGFIGRKKSRIFCVKFVIPEGKLLLFLTQSFCAITSGRLKA